PDICDAYVCAAEEQALARHRPHDARRVPSQFASPLYVVGYSVHFEQRQGRGRKLACLPCRNQQLLSVGVRQNPADKHSFLGRAENEFLPESRFRLTIDSIATWV